MKKSIVSNLLVGFSILLLLGGTAWAELYHHVSIDVSSLVGNAIELEIDLFDNSGVIGDSWALIDNVIFGAEVADFEDATLQGFTVDSLNPLSVGVFPGSLSSGNWLLRIDEDLGVTPTITWRDFLPSTATTLSFDFKLISDGTVGPWGQDSLVVNLLDPFTLNPLVPGLYGFGDVLEATASGAVYSPGVEVELVPVPPALLLGMIGIGTAGAGLFRRLRKSV